MKIATVKKAVCPVCGGITIDGRHYVDRGRRIGLTDAQIEAILRNHLSEDGLTGKDFCVVNDYVKPMTYSNVIRLNIKNPPDRARIRGIAASMGYKFDDDAGCWVKSSASGTLGGRFYE